MLVHVLASAPLRGLPAETSLLPFPIPPAGRGSATASSLGLRTCITSGRGLTMERKELELLYLLFPLHVAIMTTKVSVLARASDW